MDAGPARRGLSKTDAFVIAAVVTIVFAILYPIFNQRGGEYSGPNQSVSGVLEWKWRRFGIQSDRMRRELVAIEQGNPPELRKAIESYMGDKLRAPWVTTVVVIEAMTHQKWKVAMEAYRPLYRQGISRDDHLQDLQTAVYAELCIRAGANEEAAIVLGLRGATAVELTRQIASLYDSGEETRHARDLREYGISDETSEFFRDPHFHLRLKSMATGPELGQPVPMDWMVSPSTG